MACTRTLWDCPAGEQPGREGPEGPGAQGDHKPAMCPWDKAAAGGASPMGWGGEPGPLLSRVGHTCRAVARAGVTSTRHTRILE